MALSKERIGELAMLALIAKLEDEGLALRPKEAKRQVANAAQKLNIPASEFAEFSIVVYEKSYTHMIEQLNKIAAGKVEG